MSCELCEEAQEEYGKDPSEYRRSWFIRIGPSNMQLIGCPQHVRATMALLRQAMDLHPEYKDFDLMPPNA